MGAREAWRLSSIRERHRHLAEAVRSALAFELAGSLDEREPHACLRPGSRDADLQVVAPDPALHVRAASKRRPFDERVVADRSSVGADPRIPAESRSPAESVARRPERDVRDWEVAGQIRSPTKHRPGIAIGERRADVAAGSEREIE